MTRKMKAKMETKTTKSSSDGGKHKVACKTDVFLMHAVCVFYVHIILSK
jgi:hypothetical protein